MSLLARNEIRREVALKIDMKGIEPEDKDNSNGLGYGSVADFFQYGN
jgi:hypothetical protein